MKIIFCGIRPNYSKKLRTVFFQNLTELPYAKIKKKDKKCEKCEN